MQLQLRLDLWLNRCCRQWLAIGDCCWLWLLVPDLCDDLLLRLLLLVLHTYLGLGLWLRLRLIRDCLAMLLGLYLWLMLMLYTWTGRWLFLLFLVVVVALVFVVVLGEVAFRVAQRHVRLALMLLQIDRLVEIVVHDMILGGLLADVVVRGGHANQVDLVEGEAFGADPRVLLALLAVVEDLTAQRLIGVVTEEHRERRRERVEVFVYLRFHLCLPRVTIVATE